MEYKLRIKGGLFLTIKWRLRPYPHRIIAISPGRLSHHTTCRHTQTQTHHITAYATMHVGLYNIIIHRRILHYSWIYGWWGESGWEAVGWDPHISALTILGIRCTETGWAQLHLVFVLWTSHDVCVCAHMDPGATHRWQRHFISVRWDFMVNIVVCWWKSYWLLAFKVNALPLL